MRMLTTSAGVVEPRAVACVQALIEQEMARGYAPPVDPETLAYALVHLRHAFLWNDTTVGIRGDYERLREVSAALLGVPVKPRGSAPRAASARSTKCPPTRLRAGLDAGCAAPDGSPSGTARGLATRPAGRRRRLARGRSPRPRPKLDASAGRPTARSLARRPGSRSARPASRRSARRRRSRSGGCGRRSSTARTSSRGRWSSSGRNTSSAAPQTAPISEPRPPITTPASSVSDSCIGNAPGEPSAGTTASRPPPRPAARRADHERQRAAGARRAGPASDAAISSSRTARQRPTDRRCGSGCRSTNTTTSAPMQAIHASQRSSGKFDAERGGRGRRIDRSGRSRRRTRVGNWSASAGRPTANASVAPAR